MKSLLLAKSNMRKNKSASIGVSILILISAVFISISCLLITDYKENFSNEAERLDTTEAELSATFKDSNKSYVESIMPDTVKDYEYNDSISVKAPIKMNGKETNVSIGLETKEALERKISKIEIIDEDISINENYIYVPYHVHVSGGADIGDNYEIKFPKKTYEFKVKGYINTIYDGSNNAGAYIMIVSDNDYNKVLNENPDNKSFNLYMNYRDGVDISKETNKIGNKIFSDKGVKSLKVTLDDVLASRTFISDMFLAFFIIISVVVIAIIILMITNNISNYIKENIKDLGLLKAMGYTSLDIKKTLFLQFSILSILGLVFGVALSYLLMPMITKLLVAQSGILYTVKFDIFSTLITFVSMYTLVIFIVAISVRKINKLKIITALRDGMEVHNFKRNHIALDKFKMPVNLSLSFKNMFKNNKQNTVTFIIIICLSFLMVISMAIYQNFSREPKISLLNFELYDGSFAIDKEIEDDIVNDLKNDKDIKDFNYSASSSVSDNDDNNISMYILKDSGKIKNEDYCYEGRYPKYDNEVCINGKYAEKNGYEVGDTIELKAGNCTFTYVITGFTLSLGGANGVMLYDGASHIIDMKNVDVKYTFETDEEVSKILDKYKDKYGDKILKTVDFDETVQGMLGTFIKASNLIAIVITIITGAIIILVLFLLIKVLVYDRRYEYGILKAVGYRAKDLIVQNVISFMFIIVLATLFGTFISYYLTSPFMSAMMSTIGVMKCNMTLPMDLMLITVAFVIGISLITSILMLLRIKKIEPKKLLVGE